VDVSDYWNQQRLILRAVPAGCGTALDIGCGDGSLVRRLAERCAHVTGIDPDADTIALARERTSNTCVSFVEADLLSYPETETGCYDFICANQTLQQVDFELALDNVARLLRPGGRAVITGLARDAPEMSAPEQAAQMSLPDQAGAAAGWRDVRTAARRTLPGVRYRRHLLGRYSLTWNKPALGRASVRVNEISEPS